MGACGSTPKTPDYDEAARQGVYANLESFPLEYLVNQAARMGTKVTVDGTPYDFTGLGDVDSARVMSDKMAAVLLDIQKNMGPEYIKQRIEELKAADPQGYAARKQLFDRIVASATAAPGQPLAQDLQQSILGELAKGGRLDARETEQVQQATRGGQVARGNYLGNAATAQEASNLVRATEQKRDTGQQQALNFVESGAAPEDVEYRRIQQAIANLANFQAGRTPTAQFGSLSSAGNGAVPFMGGGPSQFTTNPNAGISGAQNALQIYSGKINWNNSQMNPYWAGLSMAPKIYATGVNAGAWEGL